MGASSPSPFWWPDAPGPELTVAELLASRVALRGDATALIAPSLLAADAAGARGDDAHLRRAARARAADGERPPRRRGRARRPGRDPARQRRRDRGPDHLPRVPPARRDQRAAEHPLRHPRARVRARLHRTEGGRLQPAPTPTGSPPCADALGEAALLEAGTAPPTLGRPLGELLAAASPLPDPAPLDPDAGRRLALHLRHHRQPEGGRAHPPRLGRLRLPVGRRLGPRPRQRLPVLRPLLHQHRLPLEPARLPRRRLRLRGRARVRRPGDARPDRAPRHHLDLPHQQRADADPRTPHAARNWPPTTSPPCAASVTAPSPRAPPSTTRSRRRSARPGGSNWSTSTASPRAARPAST